MSDLPFNYRLEWEWYSKTRWCGAREPDLDTLKQGINDKVYAKFYEEYLKQGWALQVGVVHTDITNVVTHVGEPWGTQWKHEVWGTTTVEFWTDHKAMGSPIEPTTLIVLGLIITAVAGVVKALLYFKVFELLRSTLYDVGEGISEVFGLGSGKAGLGLLILLVIGIVAVWLIGKYFWKKKKK